MTDRNKVISVITNKKHLIIATALLTAIGLGIVGIIIYQNAQEITSLRALQQLTDTQYNHIRLEIFKLCFVMFLIATVGATCIMLCLKIKLEYIYLVAALCLGTTYMVAMTPFSIPDERHHYHSSYHLSGYILRSDNPEMIELRHFDYSRTAGHHNTPEAYLRLMDEGISIDRGETALTNLDIQDMYSSDYPLFYLPQALGISIARLIGLSFFGVFYFGRFFNLLFYTICVTFSIKRLKAFRLPIFLIGLLPLSLHQAASFSNDAFINGISMLFIAYAISCIYEKDKFHWHDYAILLVTGVLLAPAKGVYLPIVFLIFIVAWKWKEAIKSKAWIMAASIAAAAIAAVLLLVGTRTAAGLAGDQQLNWEGGYNYTLAFVLENPLATIMIFLRTLRYDRVYLFESTFGRYLSGQTLLLPVFYAYVTLALLIAGVLYGKRDEWQPKIMHRAFYFAISAMVVVLCMAAMFFGWTSDFRNVVVGVQGRYFTPLLPLALLMLRNNKLLVQYDSYRNVVIVASISMQCAVIMYVINYTIGARG